MKSMATQFKERLSTDGPKEPKEFFEAMVTVDPSAAVEWIDELKIYIMFSDSSKMIVNIVEETLH